MVEPFSAFRLQSEGPRDLIPQRLSGSFPANSKNVIHGPQGMSFRIIVFLYRELKRKKEGIVPYSREVPESGILFCLPALEVKALWDRRSNRMRCSVQLLVQVSRCLQFQPGLQYYLQKRVLSQEKE